MKLKPFLHFIDLKTLNDCYMKTTYPTELKLTELIEQVNNDLYTDFQTILNFYKFFGIFNFEGHRCLLWSCKYANKLKN